MISPVFPGFFLKSIKETYNINIPFPSIKKNLPSDVCAAQIMAAIFAWGFEANLIPEA